MLHQPDKEWQIICIYPLFIQGQDIISLIGSQQVVGIFHPLGNASKAQQIAKLIFA